MTMLKEQFALIAILVVLIGTVYTDYYYASFGIRYQSLNLPASHILYRGFTILRDAPYVALPYLLAVILLVTDVAAGHTWYAKNRLRLSYLVIAIVLVLSYILASVAGKNAAKTDLSTSSTLPKVKQLVGSDDSPCEPDACRLLIIDGDYLYVFVPTGNVPTVKRLDKRMFHEIDTGTQ